MKKLITLNLLLILNAVCKLITINLLLSEMVSWWHTNQSSTFIRTKPYSDRYHHWRLKNDQSRTITLNGTFIAHIVVSTYLAWKTINWKSNWRRCRKTFFHISQDLCKQENRVEHVLSSHFVYVVSLLLFEYGHLLYWGCGGMMLYTRITRICCCCWLLLSLFGDLFFCRVGVEIRWMAMCMSYDSCMCEN